MSFWAYMLHCNEGRLYVGHTDDLERRIWQHETGAIPWIHPQLPPGEAGLVSGVTTREEAKAAEKQIKGWSRAKKLALIRGHWEQISLLAKNKTGLRQAQASRMGE